MIQTKCVVFIVHVNIICFDLEDVEPISRPHFGLCRFRISPVAGKKPGLAQQSAGLGFCYHGTTGI